MHELPTLVAAFTAGLLTSKMSAQMAGIRDFHFTSSGHGWLISGDHVLLTASGGQNWSDSNVPATAYHADSAFFLDDSQGWVIQHSDSGGIRVAKTTNAGQTWDSIVIPADAVFRRSFTGGASISFSDSQHGWALLKQTGSSALSAGKLFRTNDGGSTWVEISAPPVAGRIEFFSQEIGWLSGGAAQTKLFKTTDAGDHWIQQSVPPAKSAASAISTNYELPAFSDLVAGSVHVEFVNANRTVTEAAYSTV